MAGQQHVEQGDGGVGEWKCLVILAAGALAMLCVGS